MSQFNIISWDIFKGGEDVFGKRGHEIVSTAYNVAIKGIFPKKRKNHSLINFLFKRRQRDFGRETKANPCNPHGIANLNAKSDKLKKYIKVTPFLRGQPVSKVLLNELLSLH